MTTAAQHAGDYAGAATALDFGDPAAEFRALRGACGVFSLDWRRKLILTGADRVRWLNGMVTNNVRDLGPDRGVYAFLLNAQGRIQADLYAFNRGEYLLVDTDAAQFAKLKEFFDRFIIMDDVEVADASAKLAALAVHGPAAEDVLRRAGLEPAALEPLQVRDVVVNGIGLSLVRSDIPRRFEVWCTPENVSALWGLLTTSGAAPVGADAVEALRIALGIPMFGRDLRERDLPQETAQDRALHFNKGCYVGQEIVERIHARGNVHRTLTGFTLRADAAAGEKLMKDGKEVGELTSVARVGGRFLALGYIRREASAPGTEFQAGSTSAIVTKLPFQLD